MTVCNLTEDDVLTPLEMAGLAEGFAFLDRLAREHARGDFARDGAALFGVWGSVGDGHDDDLRLLGACGLTLDPYLGEPTVGRVRHLYVLLESRRSGVGRALLEAVVAEARQHYQRLRLRTPTAAGAAFYQACGFVRVSEPEATHSLLLATCGGRAGG